MSPESIQELFDRAAEKFPGRTAVEGAVTSLSYGELQAAANRLANFIISAGAPRGSRIAIITEDVAAIATAIIATLKARCVFAPLDPRFPQKRLEAMTERVGPQLFICGPDGVGIGSALARGRGGDANVISLNGTTFETNDGGAFRLVKDTSRSSDDPGLTSDPDDTCYVYFTPSPTGSPSAVVARLKAVAHFIRWEIQTLGLEPGTRVSQLIDLNSEAFLRDLFVPLCCGGTLCVPPGRASDLDAAALADWLGREHVNVIHCVPSLFRAMVKAGPTPEHFSSLKHILLSGEALLPSDVRGWLRVFGERVRLLNLYGTTETTLSKFCYFVSPSDEHRQNIPVGKPIEGARAIVLDEKSLTACPPGVAGEIYIRTPYRSLGYLNQPVLTKERFIPNPFNNNPADLIYKTGDLGRVLEDGNFQVLGRRDQQVKRRGLRVELNEIEKLLCEHDAVSDAAVTERESGDGEKSLCAYVVPKGGAGMGDLKEYLGGVLPAYMIPSSFEAVGSLPLTPAGTLDRAALPGWGSSLAGARVQEHAHDGGASGGHGAAAAIKPVEPQPSYELSHAQRRLWVLDQLGGHQPAYNMSNALILEGPLDQSALARALGDLVARHESLRTTFAVVDGEPRQFIRPPSEHPFSFAFFDLSGRPDPHAEARAMAGRKGAAPFDLSTGPLLRAALLRLADEHHVFVLTLHHIVSDGWSLGVLANEVLTSYAAYQRGEPSPHAPLRIQYKDYAAWQHELLNGERAREYQRYWLEQFADGVPLLELPTDFPRPAVKSFAGRRVRAVWGEELRRSLTEASWRLRASLFMVLVAGVNALLHRYTGQEDIVIGTPTAGRNHTELEGQIGFYVNTVALRTRVSGGESFAQLVGRVRATTLGGFEHEAYPFDRLVEELRLRRDASRSPLFDVMVGLQNAPTAQVGRALAGIKVSDFEAERATSKFDLSFEFFESERGIVLDIEYDTGLYRGESIRRMAGHLEELLRAAAGDPDALVADLPLLTEGERQLVLGEWNRTAEEYERGGYILELFEERAAHAGGAVAVVSEAGRLTYAEVNARANQLAHRLRKLGVEPESRVAILLERSPEMVVALFAVLKAGGAYVPLDPRAPQDRLAFMLEDASVSILLTQSSLVGLLPENSLHIFLLDTGWDDISGEPEVNLEPVAGGDNLISVLYTSGSTGRPKGVMIHGDGFLNLCLWYVRHYPFTPQSRSMLMMVFSFDAAFKNIVVPLLTGGQLILANPGYYDAACLLNAAEEHRVTFINTTPSQMYPILELAEADDYRGLSSLECLIIGGEPMSLPRLKKWLRSENCRSRLVNLYGPTECSDSVTTYQLKDEELDHLEIVPVGRGLSNAQVFVLDGRQHLLPAGVAGELCVAGDLVARGYLNRPGLTAEKFVPNPYGRGDRLYRTGDRARWREDGQLEVLGRMEQGQVKLRGMRVEMGEVESVLKAYAPLREAVVVAREDTPGDKRLVAYVVLRDSGATLTTAEIRGHISGKLPDYMVPSSFVVLDALPLTRTGKLDRGGLPSPEDPRATVLSLGAEYLAPANEVEAKLAEAWQEVLGRKRVGTLENYFDAGGDSIRAIQIATRLRREGLELKVRDLFRYPTIAALAPQLKWLGGSAAEQSAVVGLVPPTPFQRQLLSAGPPEALRHFAQTVVLTSPRGFDRDAVAAVFGKLGEHHDALRIRLGERARALFGEGLAMTPAVFESDRRGAADPEAQLQESVGELCAALNPERGPLVAVLLLHLPDSDRLVIAAHQLIADEVSWDILLEDTATLYGQYAQGESLSLPLKTDSFKRWAEHLAELSAAPETLDEKVYWDAVEAEKVPAIEAEESVAVERDGGRSEHLTAERVSVSFELTEEETELLLTRVNTAFNTETADILLAALGLAVHESFGHRKAAVVLEGSGRDAPPDGMDFGRTVGCFTHTYPAVLYLHHAGDLSRHIKETKESLRRVPRGGIGYGLLKQAAECEAGSSAGLRPQIFFRFQNRGAEVMGQRPFAVALRAHSRHARAPHEMEFACVVSGGRLGVNLGFEQGRYRRESLEGLLETFRSALLDIIAYCSEKEITELTSSDFTYKGLSVEAMDNLFDAEFP